MPLAESCLTKAVWWGNPHALLACHGNCDCKKKKKKNEPSTTPIKVFLNKKRQETKQDKRQDKRQDSRQDKISQHFASNALAQKK